MSWTNKEDQSIPDGTVLVARVEAIEDGSYEWGGKKIEKIQWVFRIVQDCKWKDLTLKRKTTAQMSATPGNELREFCEAVLKRDIAVNDIVDPDDVIGSLVKVVTGFETGKNGAVFTKVDSLIPYTGSTTDEAPF
jgi:hypothetical protein